MRCENVCNVAVGRSDVIDAEQRWDGRALVGTKLSSLLQVVRVMKKFRKVKFIDIETIEMLWLMLVVK